MNHAAVGKVLFLDASTIDLGDIDLSGLQSVAPQLEVFATTTTDELPHRDKSAWCVITNKVVLNSGFFRTRPALKLVCVTATGTNNVDLEAAREQGVAVYNCQGYGTDAVAQHTLMLILALSRNLPAYQRDVAAGHWARSNIFCLLDHPIRDLTGLKLGVLGYGEIGQRIASLAGAFGMELLVSERPGLSTIRPGRLAFEQVLSESDVLSLNCPLTAETAELINARTLKQMKPDAILVNTARGGLVHEQALVEALQNNTIAGAAVDVASREPLPANHPFMTPGINLIVTPHCAWGSQTARQNTIAQTADNIRAWRLGARGRRVD